MSDTAGQAIKAINGIDAARRVGWAKAFSNGEKLDGALRDLNIMRGDRDAYCRGVSFLLGAFTAVVEAPATFRGRTHIMRQLLERYAGADFVLDDDAKSDGVAAVAAIRAADSVYDDEYAIERAARQAAKKASNRRHRHQWADAQERALRRLAARHGFTSVAQMFAVLASWQKATGAGGRHWKTVTYRQSDLDGIGDSGEEVTP